MEETVNIVANRYTLMYVCAAVYFYLLIYFRYYSFILYFLKFW